MAARSIQLQANIWQMTMIKTLENCMESQQVNTTHSAQKVNGRTMNSKTASAESSNKTLNFPELQRLTHMVSII